MAIESELIKGGQGRSADETEVGLGRVLWAGALMFGCIVVVIAAKFFGK